MITHNSRKVGYREGLSASKKLSMLEEKLRNVYKNIYIETQQPENIYYVHHSSRIL